jgi:hypothetical protein
MVVPIGIQIVEVEGTDVTPEKCDFEPFLREGERVFYWREPPAAVLAEQFFLILQNMELVVQMSPYERIWDILSKESVDGRHVGELLRENCEKGEIPFEPHRVEEVVAYKNYTFMRKRWEKHLKKRKMDHPGWEEVMEYVEAFLPAIWNTICRNEIFFGDWMPGIRRFLD